MRRARFLFILLIFTMCPTWSGQFGIFAQVPNDSSDISVRLPANDAIDAYKKDPEFIYEHPQKPGVLTRLYSKASRWLMRHLQSVFPQSVVEMTFRAFPYLIVIAAVVIAIRILLKTKLTGLISRENRQIDLQFQQLGASFDEIDFDANIRQAVEAQDWKNAVRYSYLQMLGKLSENGQIQWQRDKTNHEYIAEITATGLRGPFERLTFLFEFVYYGDFAISKHRFENVAGEFRQFETLIAEVR